MAPKQTDTDEIEAVAAADQSLPDEDVLPAGEEQPVPDWAKADEPKPAASKLNELLDRAMAEALSDDDDDLIITEEDLAADAALTDDDLERLTGVPLPPADEEAQPLLDLKQFEHDPDLWSAATRLRYAGLLVDVADIRLEGPPYNHAVVIKCRSEEGYNLVQAAMPRHLVQIGDRRELLEIVVRESLYDDHPQATNDALDLLDSTDDPLITALQTQLGEAIAENNRLRAELTALQARTADDAEAEAAMEVARRHIRSLTLVFPDVERDSGDQRIAELIAEGWWPVPHSEHFLVRTNAEGRQVIVHALRFEYTQSPPRRQHQLAADGLLMQEDLPLVEDEPTDGLRIAVGVTP